MRNYMFERSPALGGRCVSPARAQRCWPRKRGLLVMALFLLLIAALTALTLILQHMSPAASTPGAGNSPGYDAVDPGFGILPGLFEHDSEDIPETTIPRAEVGTGALMSITQERGETLSGTDIYKKVLPSIVSINAFSGTTGSSGSGVVMSEDGYILTNFHVIEGTRQAAVTLLSDNRTFQAELVGYYADLDIAVLKIDVQGLTPAEFGSSRNLEEGETVYAIGNPMGYLYGSITNGIVSALNRSVTISGHSMTLIQTNAALNSGNSGGALVNSSGQVVGITVAKIAPPSEVTTEGLGLAIPICDARRCVNSLLRTGEMENPAIGITCKDWPEGEGVLVVTVNDNSPAKEAGLLPNDVILSAGGVAVGGVEELKDRIYDLGVGAELRCTVLRNGSELELSFVLYES